MNKIIGIILAGVCLLGCKKEQEIHDNKAQEIHDPLLRQQLTTIIASFNTEDDSAAKKADNDLEAVLLVNSTKLSKDQQKKLSLARRSLIDLGFDISTLRYYKAMGMAEKGILDPKKDMTTEIFELTSEAKKLISEVAAAF